MVSFLDYSSGDVIQRVSIVADSSAIMSSESGSVWDVGISQESLSPSWTTSTSSLVTCATSGSAAWGGSQSQPGGSWPNELLPSASRSDTSSASDTSAAAAAAAAVVSDGSLGLGSMWQAIQQIVTPKEDNFAISDPAKAASSFAAATSADSWGSSATAGGSWGAQQVPAAVSESAAQAATSSAATHSWGERISGSTGGWGDAPAAASVPESSG